MVSNLKVAIDFAQIGELLELEHKLHVAKGLNERHDAELGRLEHGEQLLELGARVVVLVAHRLQV